MFLVNRRNQNYCTRRGGGRRRGIISISISLSLVLSRCCSIQLGSAVNSEEIEIDRICKMINEHPFPYPPLEPSLSYSRLCISSGLVERILKRLLIGHSNGLKALQFFRWAGRVHNSSNNNHHHFANCDLIVNCHCYKHSTVSYELMLQILTRIGDFERAWQVFDEMHRQHHRVSPRAISFILFRYAKKRSLEETLDAFVRMEKYTGELNVEVFNVLLKGFCAQNLMAEARVLLNLMQARFNPNTETFNILLLGFKKSSNAAMAEMFFRDMVRRGFRPNNVTYNILIDALCKSRKVDSALEVLDHMKQNQCCPDVQTYTTLIHGLGIVCDSVRARQVFAEMESKGLQPDTAAFNAVISSFCKGGMAENGLLVMKEMEQNGVPCNSRTYHNVFLALIQARSDGAVRWLFDKMVMSNFIPRSITVTILLKYFCESKQHHMAFKLWSYVMDKGCCPHGHAINIVVEELCSCGRLQEAYTLCKQMIEKGIQPPKRAHDSLCKHFKGTRRLKQLSELSEKTKQLRSFLPPTRNQS